MAALIDPSRTSQALRERSQISFVDMARWMAAMMVMVGHLRNPLILGYGDLAAGERPIWVQGWFFVTGFHAEAVLVFFVLSGYLVGGLSAVRAWAGSFRLESYAIDRVSRLFIAFIPALFLTLALDWAGARWFGGTGLYDGTHPMIIAKNHGIVFQDFLTPGIFFGNMAMVQYYFVPELGSNSPLWTLSTEFWFYAVFGLLLAGWLARSGASRWVQIGLGLVFAAILGPEFIGFFGLWLIGFLVALIPSRRFAWPLIAAGALFVWLAFLRLNDAWFDAHLGWKLAGQYVMALLFGWLIHAMSCHRYRLFEWLQPFNKFMADFSYSLYLIHFPVMIFLMAVLGSVTGLAGFANAFSPADPMGVIFYAGLIGAILVISWLFAQATERHTARLRNGLKAGFGVVGGGS
ncbi:MAG: acyltransferase [Blastomonas sp.]